MRILLVSADASNMKPALEALGVVVEAVRDVTAMDARMGAMSYDVIVLDGDLSRANPLATYTDE